MYGEKRMNPAMRGLKLRFMGGFTVPNAEHIRHVTHN